MNKTLNVAAAFTKYTIHFNHFVRTAGKVNKQQKRKIAVSNTI